ncbi:MAG: hypothetical protein ACJ76X_04275 [Solirubrobacteraceae bacterium]
MRRGKRHPADDDQDNTLVLHRDELDYPIPAPPAEHPTRVHPVAAPPIDAPTEALPRTDAAPRPAAPTRPARTRPARTRRLRAAPALALGGAAAVAIAIAIGLAVGSGKGGNTQATVRTDANIRTAPSTGSNVIGTLAAGQHITIACATKPAGAGAGAGTWDRLASPQPGRYVASWLVSPAGKPAAC